MIAAILAALLAVVVCLAIIAVVFVLRSRNRTPMAKPGKTRKVALVDSVGVSAETPKSAHKGSDGVHALPDQLSVQRPSDSLKSRFLALGIFATAIFGSLGVKLWTMQVLSSDKYSQEAAQNLYSTVYTPAPRGTICDADGLALVKNRTSLTILADPDVADDHDVVLRLSAVLGVPFNVIRQRIQDSSSGAQSQRVVSSDASLRNVAFVSEHSDAFDGVTVQSRTVRDYPYGALAAHAIGYVGTASESELNSEAEGRDIKSTDGVGKSGVEAAYDSVLAGDHGERRVVVDANGNVLEVASETQPVKGSDLWLTIKGPVQYACDKALADLIGPDDGTIGSGTGVAGAVVVMDVRDGGIVAMSSYPTYNPENFIGGIPQDIWDLYNTDTSFEPLLNRVIAGQYPAASTYKAFSALAGLKYGFADSTTTWDCTGSWDGFHSGDVQKCWLRTGHGILDLHGGIVNSCDTVFYEIAKAFWDHGSNGTGEVSDTALQDEIKKFNFGQKTGVDISGEEVGRVPTPEWKAEHWRNVPSEATWKGGDMTNTIIGQGDVQVTPLQMAVAYGAIATGKLMKPHLIKEVRNAQGEVVISYQPEEIATPDVDQADLEFVRDALRGVVTDNASIAALFSDTGIEAAGKTGTGEASGDKKEYAWFTCYAPFDDPKYVVACVVQEGGGGSDVGAPLGAKAMIAAMQYDEGTLDSSSMGVVAGSTGKYRENTSNTASTGRTD